MLRNIFRITESYFIVDVFPVIECDELEGGEHWPEKVVETCVTVIGVPAHIRKADVTLWTRPETFEQIHLHLHTWQLCSRNVVLNALFRPLLIGTSTYTLSFFQPKQRIQVKLVFECVLNGLVHLFNWVGQMRANQVSSQQHNELSATTNWPMAILSIVMKGFHRKDILNIKAQKLNSFCKPNWPFYFLCFLL